MMVFWDAEGMEGCCYVGVDEKTEQPICQMTQAKWQICSQLQFSKKRENRKLNNGAKNSDPKAGSSGWIDGG